tara:strand:- start:1023 stop:1367 length:345 start_codon:yes stop_codon:yes gene_type:complete
LIPIALFLLVWGAFLLTLFDGLLSLLDSHGLLLRRLALAGLIALPGGALAGHLRSRFALELRDAFPTALIGTPALTFLCASAALWAASFQLLRWRALRAARAAASELPLSEGPS